MIRDGINGVMMVIRVDLRSLVKFGAVSLKSRCTTEVPGNTF